MYVLSKKSKTFLHSYFSFLFKSVSHKAEFEMPKEQNIFKSNKEYGERKIKLGALQILTTLTISQPLDSTTSILKSLLCIEVMTANRQRELTVSI